MDALPEESIIALIFIGLFMIWCIIGGIRAVRNSTGRNNGSGGGDGNSGDSGGGDGGGGDGGC